MHCQGDRPPRTRPSLPRRNTSSLTPPTSCANSQKRVRELVVRPIGVVHSPLEEKADAPRQGTAHGSASGRIVLNAEFADALEDIDGFERLWLLFWFDRAPGWRPKVLPPRSETKRGVFATRSPHRPNPIGMTAVRLERVQGLTLFVYEIDVLDQTPVLDIKPYLPYADAFAESGSGWVETQDRRAPWTVLFEPIARDALAWITHASGEMLESRIMQALALGPQPHAYRRIRRAEDGSMVLAIKAWRIGFRVEERVRSLTVERVFSGYRPRELETGSGDALELHRAFMARFR
jgi:tRNA-Thr(GGU) m(6)t(6)A37 methyltransferase TsaA